MAGKNVVQLIGVTLAGLAVAVLAGCSTPYEDYEPTWTPTTDPPAVRFEAKLTRLNSVLKISYTIRNEGGEPVVAYTGLQGDRRSDPRDVYVTAREDGTVELAKRTFKVPPGMTVSDDAQQHIEGTTLAPGEQFAEEFLVDLPPKPRRPYSNFDAERMPDPVTSVLFCLGAVLARDVQPMLPPTSEGRDRYSLLGPQHLFCSEPLTLTG